MNNLIIMSILTVFLSVFLSACVKLEIKPGDVVSNTVDAGKDLYRTIKRKRNGDEERQYDFSVNYDTSQSESENVGRCRNQLMEIINASDVTLSKVISESSKIQNSDNEKLVKCMVLAEVKA